MRQADKIAYEESFEDCGTVTDVDLDEGGTFTNEYVTIKTDKAVYRCIGRVGAVEVVPLDRVQGAGRSGSGEERHRGGDDENGQCATDHGLYSTSKF